MNRDRSAEFDSYLLGEMTSDDLESFESDLLADDGMFYSVAERENELVDRFVHGKLDPQLETRFRNSLSRFPGRQKKIANAATLHTFIKEERAATPSPEKVPWYQRLGFAFRAPAFAASALGLLLIGLIGLLLIQNRSLNSELAHLNSNSANINELRQREAELQAMLEAERAAGGDLTNDLEAERERRTALEKELSDLRGQIANSKPSNNSPIVPTIATLILRPVGTRGGPETVRTLRITNDEKRVALKIYLPGDTPDGVFTVRVNDIPAGSNVKPIRDAGGVVSVSVAAPVSSFRNGMNRVDVVDANSKSVVSFAVILERGPVR
jgi:hypothetical protein